VISGIEKLRGAKRVLLLGATMLATTASAAMAHETMNYSYDERGRLVKVVRTGTVNNGVTTIYEYDKAENRKKKETTGVGQ
jgi:YD repeat-containing protein